MLTSAIFGNYRIIEKIESGGMGEIYLAIKEGKISYPAAIKILHDRLIDDPEYLALFKREVKILNLFRTINHPNIVKIFDVGNREGKYYIEMEYIPGLNLRQIMSILLNPEKKDTFKKPLIPVEHLLEIGIEVAFALEYVHSMIIAHRDMTPSNILVSHFGEVKIIDFGIAKLDENTGNLMGTLAYMSPEQIDRIPLDGRSAMPRKKATLRSQFRAATRRPISTA